MCYFYMSLFFTLLIYSCVFLCIVNILNLFFPLLILITEASVGLHWLPCFPACSLAHGALFLSVFCPSWLWVHIAWIFICRNYLKPAFKMFSLEGICICFHHSLVPPWTWTHRKLISLLEVSGPSRWYEFSQATNQSEGQFEVIKW